MLLGFGAFAELPFSASGNDGNVTIAISKNQLTLTIGPVGQEVTSVVQTSGADRLYLGTGTVIISGNALVDSGLKNPLVLGTGDVTVVTISGNANVEDLKVPLTLGTKESGVITWNEVIPGVAMTWIPIDPY